jgi:phosphonate transport system substrate-binding protein
MSSALNYSVSPYLVQDNKTVWPEFEKFLHKKTKLSLQFKNYTSPRAFNKDFRKGKLGLIYADPYYASVLLRNHGFIPVARALGQYDETIVAVRADSSILDIQDLNPQMYLSISVEPVNRLLGRLLLQPADINEDDMVCRYHRTHKSVVQDLLLDKTDVGVMAAKNFDRLPSKIKTRLRILVRTQVYLFSSLWMLSPEHTEQYPALARVFNRMHRNQKGTDILKNFNTKSWLNVEQINAEEMADLLHMLR